MPDIWTHYFFAKQVMYEQRLKITHPDWYYLGAQGPDFLFYQGFQPWKKTAKPGTNLAKLFHQKKTKRVLEFVLTRRSKADPVLSDYLSGFLCHYALDASVHPMIHRDASDGKEHKQLEMALDMRLYSERRNRPISEASVTRVMARSRKLPQSIARFYVDLADSVFDTLIDEDLIQKSYGDFRKFHKYTSLGSNWRKGLIESGLKRSGADYAHYFYGDYIASIRIPEAQYDEFIVRFLNGRELFRQLNQEVLPDEVVNFSGAKLESTP